MPIYTLGLAALALALDLLTQRLVTDFALTP
jgi:hypothetical protein